MSKSNDIFSLPAAPPELCFDKNEFMKKTFSVDDFLHEHRNAASLETMRDDLGIYLKVLRSAMIELINQDYADFVNLSTNLIGLDDQIKAIETPLNQLSDDVLNVKQVIQDTIDEINECKAQKEKLKQFKSNLKSLAKVYTAINKLSDLLEKQLSDDDVKPVVLERAALEFVQLQFHAKRCSDYLDEGRAGKPEILHKQLLEKLRKYFLKCLEADTESLERCLRIYATLEEYQEAEAVFRDEIVGKYMDSRISENTLQNSSQGLVGIYNQVLDFIAIHMKDLLLLTHHTDRVKGFNFLVNSFWQDVEHRLECNLSSIFAPGNPDSFFVKYKSTSGFLANIEKILGTEKSIEEFHQHPQYESFQSRWNLPVYFQIRFQDIAGRLERVCNETLSDNVIKADGKEFKCIIFNTAHSCIEKLWAEGIYVEQIFPKFWRLTLQIIGRTARWVEASIKEPEDSSEDQTAKHNRDNHLVILHRDAKKLISYFPDIVKVAKDKAPSCMYEHFSALDECILESEKLLVQQMTTIEDLLMKQIVSKSGMNIRQANDIPRLYRKTNRDVPSKHCAYVDLMMEPFKAFKKDFVEDLGEETIQDIFTKAFSTITVQYYKAIEEVITSVQKTEESLRRLKNLRDRSSASTTTASSSSQSSTDRQVISDDDKIRLQLQIDVRHWTNEIETNGIKREDVTSLSEMVSLVEDTAKTNKTSDK